MGTILIALGFYGYLLSLMWWTSRSPPDDSQEDIFP